MTKLSHNIDFKRGKKLASFKIKIEQDGGYIEVALAPLTQWP